MLLLIIVVCTGHVINMVKRSTYCMSLNQQETKHWSNVDEKKMRQYLPALYSVRNEIQYIFLLSTAASLTSDSTLPNLWFIEALIWMRRRRRSDLFMSEARPRLYTNFHWGVQYIMTHKKKQCCSGQSLLIAVAVCHWPNCNGWGCQPLYPWLP